jgi:1-acyl-sn-glycerol-3-phosphate acyltransferase
MRSTELNPGWRFISTVTVVLTRMFFRVHVEGASHVPAHGAAIVAFNHVSVLDGPVLGGQVARRRGRESRFLVAAEVFQKRLFGWILRTFDQIPIRRGQGDVGALDEAIRTVAGGAIAAIAPEGRVNENGGTELLRIRSGIARLALNTSAPVVPVGIWGTQKRWPHSGLRYGRPWRPRLAFVFGDPLTPSGDPTDAADIEAFTQRVREAIEVQVTRARAISERT